MKTRALTMKHQHIEALVRELFEHQVLLLSQWALAINLSDRQQWYLVRLLDSSRCRISRRLREELPQQKHADRRGVQHPAFRTFLTQLRNQPRSRNRAPVAAGMHNDP